MENLFVAPFQTPNVPPLSDINTSAVQVTDNEAHSSTSETDSPTRRSGRKRIIRTGMTDVAHEPPKVGHSDRDDDGATKGSGKGGKSRRELPAGAVATLKAWLLSPEHFTHPYPTPQDQVLLMQQTGIDKKQLKNWFTNARRRIWKPMLKKQLEQGKIAQTGSGGVVALPGATQGLIGAPAPGTEFMQGTALEHSHVMPQNFQQPLQASNPQTTTNASYDSFGNHTNYVQQQQAQPSTQNTMPTADTGMSVVNASAQNYTAYFNQGQYSQQQSNVGEVVPQNASSLGSMPTMTGSTASGTISNLNKTDSHAVLMELFKRDQDLVQQERAKQQRHSNNTPNNGVIQSGSQHPMSKIAGGSTTQNKLGTSPSLNSWPHFSSVSSLNNLGNMTGVKSITNMSGADLVSQGSLNKKGNLAQVKSIENMGRTDSLAFLEIFFEAGSGSSQAQRGVKREREEDENVGLSLDGDEASTTAPAPASATNTSIKSEPAITTSMSGTNINEKESKEGLKRAYDDALAARGLISVSRSSEKLTDLALPAKMQRTISQEYLKSVGAATTFTSFSFASQNTSNDNSANSPAAGPASTNVYPPPHGFATQTSTTQTNYSAPVPAPIGLVSSPVPTTAPLSDPNSSSVKVPNTTKCAICGQINVDTQLRPCGHMFHGRCLKPSLQQAVGPPKCPIDGIPMQSAVLAVPTDDSASQNTCVPVTTPLASNFYQPQSATTMSKAEAST